METIKNKGYVEKLYVLLGASIFIHYVLLVLICLLILIEIFVSGEYKKILKNKSLMIVETVLGFSIIMSLFYKNYYGLIAVPILLCLMVGRYYTLIIDDNFKKNNLVFKPLTLKRIKYVLLIWDNCSLSASTLIFLGSSFLLIS